MRIGRRWGAVLAAIAVLGSLAVLGPEVDAAAATVAFAAVADGGVDASAPGRPFADPKELAADADPQRQAVLRFSVSGLTSPVERAVLRLHVRDRSWAPSASGGSIVLLGSTTWTEAGLTWPGRPLPGATLATAGAVARNTWVELDVTAAVTGNGQVDLGLVGASTDGVAYDARETGALGPQLVVTTADAPPPPTGTRTLLPAADARVEAAAPTTNRGKSWSLTAGGTPAHLSYLRFDLGSVAGPITRAQLRLHVQDFAGAESASGGDVVRVDDATWSETGITYRTRPAADGSVLWRLGAVARNTWVTVDVTGAVRAGSPLSIALLGTASDPVTFDSRESGANAPQLVLTTGAPASDPVLYAAGDIARCTSPRDEATAALLAGTTGPIAVLGDLAYPGTGATDIVDCFGPSWGPYKARMRPVPGNHEYDVVDGVPYFDYFGSQAGPRDQGWYSYDVGSWHIVALNSNCGAVGGCGAGSAQLAWLRADLAATTKPCIAATWHHPLFTSASGEAPSPVVRPLWDELAAVGADLVLNGHAHSYERFAPQTSAGVADPAGIRQFVVGTGGMSLDPFEGTVGPNSEARNGTVHGIVELTLRPAGYAWRFLPVAGTTYADSGSAACH